MRSSPIPLGWLRAAGVIAVVMIAAVVQDRIRIPDNSSAAEGRAGDVMVAQLFDARRSGEMVTVDGAVERTLADDNDGSRHQRFILRLSSGHTLLVAHNIDLADRVPLRSGDRVRVSGEYEWNEQGGVLHWTHHDPQGRRVGGWIEHEGTRYR